MQGRTLDEALRELARLRNVYPELTEPGKREENMIKRLELIDEVNGMLAEEYALTKREKTFLSLLRESPLRKEDEGLKSN